MAIGPYAQTDQGLPYRSGVIEPPTWWRVADELAARIADGRLPAGAELRGEADLASDFDVGRDTMREALAWLAGLGAIELRRGYRARVRERQVQTVAIPRGSRLVLRRPTAKEQREMGLHPTATVAEVTTGGHPALIYDALVTTFTTA